MGIGCVGRSCPLSLSACFAVDRHQLPPHRIWIGPGVRVFSRFGSGGHSGGRYSGSFGRATSHQGGQPTLQGGSTGVQRHYCYRSWRRSQFGWSSIGMDAVQCIGVYFLSNLLNGLPDEPMFSMLGGLECA